MIRYQLRCSSGHHFEGWFRNSAAYEQQELGGEIECAICQDTRVTRALMAPSLSRSLPGPAQHAAEIEATPAAAAPIEVENPPAQTAPAPVPSHMQALQMLRALRRVVEQRCENVGNQFAEEARAIHEGEAPIRGIYGSTTAEKAEALAEDGIEFLQIPWMRANDA